METHQYEHYMAKEHPHRYQKDVLGHRFDPKDCGHPGTGFLIRTIDI